MSTHGQPETERSTAQASDVTELLMAWTAGDPDAGDQLVPLIYQELKQLARYHLRRERPDHTLEPTALVHEAFLRLMQQDHRIGHCREHFYSLASQVMRRILVDHARRHASVKRGGREVVVSLDGIDVPVTSRPVDLLALDRALDRLADLDPEKASLIEMRFFSGLTIGEMATLRDTSVATLHRQLRAARAWLYRHLTGPDRAVA